MAPPRLLRGLFSSASLLHRLLPSPPLPRRGLRCSDGVFPELLLLRPSLLHQVDSPVLALASSLPPRRPRGRRPPDPPPLDRQGS